jgi:protein-L-isoaspartate(D-aspartate) O-methyltransferase
LEIGTGSGYQTAVLIEMKAFVYTIERQKDLYDFSERKLREIGLRPKFKVLVTALQAYQPLHRLIRF